jgi:hypothetical protein
MFPDPSPKKFPARLTSNENDRESANKKKLWPQTKEAIFHKDRVGWLEIWKAHVEKNARSSTKISMVGCPCVAHAKRRSSMKRYETE